jgi:cell fate regulator YaaT (PSP1 superfamily)
MSDQDIHISQKQFAREQLSLESGDQVPRKEIQARKEFLLVKFLHSNETQLCLQDETEEYRRGDYLILQSRYGKDIAEVLGTIRSLDHYDPKDAEEVIRKASDQDLQTYRDNLKKEAEALAVCKQKVARHKLDMKLVSAHYLVDEPKILFFFTADARVDFRELVKDLVAVFKMRIELRQIGVRDESRVLGGLAVCGRTYCCNGITDKLNPVSIKMAKEQNLSLNSMKISGPCGRLLCCLSYEYDFYHDEKSRLPQEGNRIRIEGEEYKVTDVNVLVKKIHLQSREGGYLELPFDSFKKDDKTGSWKVAKGDIIT